ncbi:uncharacterized protein LOC133265229 [Pezoporus flaviventris]|uniref:uncharacterized protein LOC133265229 n=1 Tax=Pezoporus flaviventris TaxID=889875 RepID=UPI002AB00711|nr:uncharacterized protein LOC133265229 [Pezoporus flaviventris]
MQAEGLKASTLCSGSAWHRLLPRHKGTRSCCSVGRWLGSAEFRGRWLSFEGSSGRELQRRPRCVLALHDGDVLCHRGSLQCIPLAFQREQWAELTEAVRQQAQAKNLLRLRLQLLLKRWEHLQEPTALSTRRNKFTSWLQVRKAERADEAKPSLLEETVAMRLDEQLATWRSKITSWLGRLCVFLLMLVVDIFFLVLLKRDTLNWVLPLKLAATLGSPPVRTRFF